MSTTDRGSVHSDERRWKGRVWCQQCSALLTTSEADLVAVCPACGRAVDWDAAIRRSHAWIALKEAEAQHEHARQAVDVAADRLDQARQQEASARSAQHAAEQAWVALNRWLAWQARQSAEQARAALDRPVPAVPPAAPAWTPAPRVPRPRVEIPLAVLLQGTGAVLLLAALITASAVLWEDMPQTLQALTLLTAVALTGACTVVARALPATSVILAVLTTASGVVVASSLPRIAPELEGLWYPTAASAVGTACLLTAGRLGRISFWWRTGWIGLGLTGFLAAAGILTGSSLEPGTTPWFGLASVLLAAVAVPLFVTAVTLREREAEAAEISWWAAMTIGLLAVVAGIAGMGRWLTDLAATSTGNPAWVATSLLALAALGYIACIAALLTDRGAASWFLLLSVAVLAVLPALALGALEIGSAGSAAVAVTPTAATAFALVWAGWRWRDDPWRLTFVGTAAATLVASVVLLNQVVLGQSAPPPYGWLLATLSALAVALAMWGYGVVVNRGGWVVAGLAVGSVAWYAAWAGGHLGAVVEVVTLGVLAALLGTWWLGNRLDLWRLRAAPAILPQLAILACLLPTAGLSLTALADGAPDGPRLLLLAGGLAAVAALAAVQRTGATLPAAAIALGAVAHTWVAVTERLADPALEWYSLPAAAGAALILLAGTVDRWTTPRAAAAIVLAAAFAPSAAALLIDPAWTPLTAARLALVATAAAATTALAWAWPAAAWAAATLGLAAALRVYAAWAEPAVQPPGGGWAPAEVLALPAALAVGLSAALAARSWAPHRATSIGTTAAIITAAVPSILLIATDPRIEHWDTAARLLVVLTLAGLLAVLLDPVAPIRSGVAATALVLLPLALYGTWLAERQGVELEAVTAPLALAGALILGWIRRPATPAQWWSRAVRSMVLTLLMTSTVWAVAAPAAGTDASTWVRMTVVATAWAAAAVVLRQRPPMAAGSGGLAVLVLWTNSMFAVAEMAEPTLEAVTWPTAAALAAACALGAWAAGRRHNSWIVAAPAVVLAVVPTAAVAWQDGEVGWRVWFGLVVGGTLVAVGAWREWAGFVYPGLVALALVTMPVLMQVAQDLPGWVPLTLVGLALLAIGARLEAARRRGGQLRHWAAHLH